MTAALAELIQCYLRVVCCDCSSHKTFDNDHDGDGHTKIGSRWSYTIPGSDLCENLSGENLQPFQSEQYGSRGRNPTLLQKPARKGSRIQEKIKRNMYGLGRHIKIDLGHYIDIELIIPRVTQKLST